VQLTGTNRCKTPAHLPPKARGLGASTENCQAAHMRPNFACVVAPYAPCGRLFPYGKNACATRWRRGQGCVFGKVAHAPRCGLGARGSRRCGFSAARVLAF